MRPLIPWLGLLGWQAASAQLTDTPSPGDFIRRAFGTATVLGDYLYFDGGEMSQMENGKIIPNGRGVTFLNSTLSLDLSQSWKTRDASIRVIDKSAPKLSYQAAWKGPGGDSFYIWAGRTRDGLEAARMTKSELWRFESDGKGGGRWSSEVPSGSGAFDDMGLPQRGAFASARGTGFHLGGTFIKDSDPRFKFDMQPVSGMISFDMETKTFSNDSAPSVSPHGTLLGGTAEYVPNYGPAGLVTVLGGYAYTLERGFRSPTDPRRFDNITFFDPESRDWHWQKATGEIPDPRLDHCSVGVKSKTDTYEIFVFGGYDHLTSQTFGDVHVLSIPAFVWKKVSSAPAGVRSGQSCAVIGNRQMVTIGGLDTFANSVWKDKDPFPQGLGIFDMTDLKWKDGYDHDAAEYVSPKPVRDWYEDVGLDSVEWSTEQTEALFATSTSPDDPGASKNKDGDSADESGSAPVGAIVGGVVGGVAVVAIVGGLVWWLRRRKRAAGKYQQPPPATDHRAGRTEMDSYTKPVEMASQPYEPLPAELYEDRTPPPLEFPPVELDGTSAVRR